MAKSSKSLRFRYFLAHLVLPALLISLALSKGKLPALARLADDGDASEGIVIPQCRLLHGQGACAWTAGCDGSYCGNICVADPTHLSPVSYLEDAAFYSGWYQTCPALASLVQRIVQSEDASSTSKPPSSFGLPCPSMESLVNLETQLVSYSKIIMSVLRKGQEGIPLLEAETAFKYVLESPNRYRTLAQLMSSPTGLNQFISQNCATMDIGMEELLYFEVSVALSTEQTVPVCRDVSGVFEKHSLLLQAAADVCAFPLSGCYIEPTGLIPSLPVCAKALAEAYGVVAKPLLQAVRILTDLDIACAQKSTQEACLNTQLPSQQAALVTAYNSFPSIVQPA